jgi:glyoxylase-like metal-dependent hydrolase (beta-lactamase superfamily II)
MPLPFALDHINLWMLEDGDGWTLVDTGINNDDTRDLWEKVFAERLGGRPVTRLIVTHFHPDHAGLAGWLTKRWGVELWMTRTDWLFARMMKAEGDVDTVRVNVEFYRRAGCGEDFLGHIRRQGSSYSNRVTTLPRSFRRLREGDVVPVGRYKWRVVMGYGHAPEHACLYCDDEKLMIAGDMVLPRISPNVSVWPNEPDANPLADFLASIRCLAELPADSKVLPSHGQPFIGLRDRIADLATHHDERLEFLAGLMDRPKTAMELASGLFDRALDKHQTMFAVGETLSHLQYLRHQGRAERLNGSEDIWRYRRV